MAYDKPYIAIYVNSLCIVCRYHYMQPCVFQVAHTKTLSKTAKKASNEDSLNEAQEALFKDHKRFTDTVFDGVGGHVAQRLARDGGTLIDSRGGGSFHVSPSTSQKREPMALEDAPAVEKKARVIEVDSFATKTELGLDKDYNILRAKCKDTLKKATEALLAAEQTDHKGQALERFVAILRQRKHLLEVVAAGSRVHSAVKAPDESSPIVKEEQDDQCGVIDVSSKSQKDLLCQMVVDCVADAENDELLREYLRVGLVLQFGTDQLVDSLRHVLETHKCLSPGPPIQRDQLIVDLKVAEVRGTSIDAEPLADDDPGGVANANPMDAFASKLDRLQGMSVRDEKYDAAVVAFSSHFSRVHGNLPASIVKTCEVVHGWNGLEFSELVDFSSLSRMVDKFRQARNSAALLQQELAARTAKKQPSMIANMEKLLTFVQIDATRYDVNACQNEHEFKALKASAKDAKDLAIKFVAVVDRGIVDVKSCIKQGEAEFLKKQTAAGQPAKKKAKLNTPTKQGKATVPHVLVTERKHATFAQFASVEDFRQAIVDKTIDLDRGAPIHIVTTANIDAIVGDRSIKTLFGVFKAQFAGKTQEDPNDSKRGMTPVLHEKKTKLRELFLESTPPNRPVAENDRSSLGAMLQNVHFWGVAPCCPANASVERQCMAAVRYQASGERELVIVHASDVLDFTESLGLNIFEGLDEKSDVPSILADLVPKILHTNERIDEFLAIASKPVIYHAVVKPSSLIILPYGCIIVERILGDGVAAGIRVPFLDACLKSKKNFKDLREMQAAYSKDNAKPDLLSKFWDQLAVAFGMDDVAVAT